MPEQFILKYPENSGFDQTKIFFHQEKVSLFSLFYEGFSENAPSSRLFVTDSRIFATPLLSDFSAHFEREKSISSEVQVFSFDKDFLLVLPPGESAKTVENVLQIVHLALEKNFTRTALFVGIGGGVICDMTAFAASIFKRGIQVQLVPTTLLSMVDAAIGGKTGCDYLGFKNMIGSFWPANRLDIIPDFVKTLSETEYRSGLGEVLKTALLFSPDLWQSLKDNRQKVLDKDENILKTIIFTCVKAKSDVVHKDFREKGIRAFLNLGHTFGHALESTAGLGSITHGEAVAWGIGRAVDLSVLLNLCPQSYSDEVKEILSSYGYDSEKTPKVLLGKDSDSSVLIDAMKKDKKNLKLGDIRFTLQKGLCDTVVMSVSEDYIRQVL